MGTLMSPVYPPDGLNCTLDLLEYSEYLMDARAYFTIVMSIASLPHDIGDSYHSHNPSC